jgi:transcriptional regulator of acetoin/glycerol metabolism
MKKQTTTPGVQNLTLTFVQNSTTVNINFDVNDNVQDSLLIGSAINELFTMQNNYKEAGITLFKATQPTLFKISNEEGTILDIGKVSKTIQNKLKFGNTAKSKRAFAKRVNVAVKEIRRAFVLIDYAELTEKLNAIQD